MPSIAHLFLGGMVGYSLYLISDKKFTKYHAMLLMLTNYLGPDLGWVLGIGDYTHTYVGYLVFSLLLGLFYSYFTRFSPDFKKRILVDKGHNQIPFANAYFIACAGGIMHVYLDGVMNHKGNFHLLPAIGDVNEVIWSIDDFFDFWYESRVPGTAVFALIAGMSLVMVFIVLYLYLLKNMDSRFALKIGLLMIAFMVLWYIFGYFTTLHADGGAVLYVALFWVIPFGLLALAMKCPPPRTPIDKRSIIKQKFIPMLLALNIIFGAIFLLAGIAFLALIETLLPLIVGAWAPLSSYENQLRVLITFLGVVFVAIGSWSTGAFVYYKKRKDININIIVASGLGWISGFIGLALSGFALTSAGVVVDIVFSMYDASEIISQEGLGVFIIALGITFGILSGLNFLAGIGTMIKNKKVMRYSFLFNAIFAWTIFGMYICCLLSQDEVKNRNA